MRKRKKETVRACHYEPQITIQSKKQLYFSHIIAREALSLVSYSTNIQEWLEKGAF